MTAILNSALLIFMLASFCSTASASTREIDSIKGAALTADADTHKVEMLWNLARLNLNAADYKETVIYAEQCQQLSKQLNFVKGMYWAYIYKGNVELFQSEYDRALLYFDSAMRAALTTGNSKYIAGGYNSLGNVHYGKHDVKRALRYYELSLEESKKGNDSREVIGAYVNLGNVYSDFGNNDLALASYLMAAREIEKIDDRILYERVNYAIGAVYRDEKQYQEALQHFFISLKIDRELGDRRSLAETYRGIASIYDAQQNKTEALEYYLKADSIAVEVNDKKTHMIVLHNIGQFFFKEENYSESEKWYQQVLRIASEAKDNYFRSCAYLGLSSVSFETKNFGESRKYCDAGLGLAKEVESISLMGDFYRRLSKLDSLQGRFKSAHLNYLQYTFWKDSLNNAEKHKKTTHALLQYEFSKREDSLQYQQKLTQAQLQKQTLIAGQEKTAKNLLIAGIILCFGLFFFAYTSYRTRQQLKLQELRNKIASDLHDDVGSTLSSISIFSQMAQAQSKEVIPALETIGESSRKMLDAMTDIVWTINPENDQFENIIMRMRSFAFELLGAKNIDFEFEADSNASKIKLTMEARKSLYLIFKEATNNLVKYADASKALFVIKTEKDKLIMMIRDNGRGFDAAKEWQGNGLKNMKKRSMEIGAQLFVESMPGNGTTIKFELAV